VSEFSIRNQSATRPEWVLAQAFDKLKIAYRFQVAPFGFTGRRGQFIVDFVVYDPFEIPVEVYGTYWHTGQFSNEDRFREAVLFNHYKREVVPFWEPELVDIESAIAAVRKKL